MSIRRQTGGRLKIRCERKISAAVSATTIKVQKVRLSAFSGYNMTLNLELVDGWKSVVSEKFLGNTLQSV